MNPLDLLALLKSHNWLPLVMLLTVYARKLVSDQSKFPVSIPTPWLPIVSTAGGLAYGIESAVAGGQTVAQAAMGGLVMAAAGGFFDSLLVAIFKHGNAPAWARWVVGAIDDLGAGMTKSGAPVFQKGSASPKPPTVLRAAIFACSICVLAPLAIGVGTAAAISGCTKQQGTIVEPPLRNLGICAADDAVKGMGIVAIAVDCLADVPEVVAALIDAAAAGKAGVKASPAFAEVVATQKAIAAHTIP